MKNGTFSQVSEEENCLFVESIINENEYYYRLITKGLKHHTIKGRGEGGGVREVSDLG